MQLAPVILEETNGDIYNIVQQTEQFDQAGSVEIGNKVHLSAIILQFYSTGKIRPLQGKSYYATQP